MTTIEKMHQIQKLMNEVESEVRETAKSVEDIDGALNRMLIEGCANYFKHMSKNLHSPTSGYQIDAWEKQLNYANNLLNKQNSFN